MMMSRCMTIVRASIVVLFIVSGGIAQESCDNGPWDNHLLLIEDGLISKVDLNGKNQEIGLKTPKISGKFNGFDYSYARKSLYWSNFKTGQIWRLRDGESEPEPALPTQRQWFPCQLKVDDPSNKMYVVDCWSNTINIFDMKTGDRAVLLSKNFTEIKAFEVDSSAGYLFVVDRYQILRTDLDGNNPVVLLEEFTSLDEMYAEAWNDLPDDVKKYLNDPKEAQTPEGSEKIKKFLSIPDIVLDPESQRIYSVETTKRRIESFNYEGKDRKVHFQDKKKGNSDESESSLSFLNGWLYWLDKTSKKLYKINTNNENQNQIILKENDSEIVYTIGCSKDRQVSKNPCAKNNGECQHLCVFSKSTEKNYVCACKIGYELDRDGISCSPSKEFILYTQSESLRGHSLNLSLESFTDIINPSAFSVGKGAGLQFNAADDLVYYSSLYPDNKLHQLNLKTGEVEILQPDLLSSKVGLSLAFDWESRNLYYFTYYYHDATTLSVMNVDDPTYSKILVHNVPRLVRAIAVHPYRGYVYYAQMSDDGWITIYRMATDGSDLKTLIHKRGTINDLSIDYQEDRLYWGEPQKIYHSNLDGEDIHEYDILNPLLENFRDFTIYKDYIYTISKQDQVLARVDKNDFNSVSVVSYVEESGSISGVEVYSTLSQKNKPEHPCNQHNCQKFCFTISDSNSGFKATCGCPYGEKLAKDGRTCEDNQNEEPRFVPCQSSSYLCDRKTEKIES